MYGFTEKYVETRSNNGEDFTVTKAFRYIAKNGEEFLIPEGTKVDGASVPRLFWILLPPFGKYWLAAILHDYLYRDTKITRSRADALLLEAMESLDVHYITRHTIYRNVRLFGWAAYKSRRKV